MVDDQYYEPGTATATLALTSMCNDHKDAFMSHIVWTDRTNGIQFTARSPWTSITEMTGGEATTRDELAALYEEEFPSGAEGSFGGGALTPRVSKLAGPTSLC
jgi:hypothetical protein